MGFVVVGVHLGVVVHIVVGVVVIHGGFVVGVVGTIHVPFVVVDWAGHLVVVVIVSLHLDLTRMGRHLQTFLQEGQCRTGVQEQDLQTSSILRGLQRQKQISGVVHEIFFGTHRHRHCTQGSPTETFIGRPWLSSIVLFATLLSVAAELGSLP